MGKTPWRRQWQPTLVLLPGESHGGRSLVGYSPWGPKESDMTEQLHFHFSLKRDKKFYDYLSCTIWAEGFYHFIFDLHIYLEKYWHMTNHYNFECKIKNCMPLYLLEKHSFICSMNTCLLTTYYVPNTIQGIGHILANKQAKKLNNAALKDLVF